MNRSYRSGKQYNMLNEVIRLLTSGVSVPICTESKERSYELLKQLKEIGFDKFRFEHRFSDIYEVDVNNPRVNSLGFHYIGIEIFPLQNPSPIKDVYIPWGSTNNIIQ
tara:strand:- start:402 stop:725 length:324 start_codon:yes stop_codon:yes gene_type:complete